MQMVKVINFVLLRTDFICSSRYRVQVAWTSLTNFCLFWPMNSSRLQQRNYNLSLQEICKCFEIYGSLFNMGLSVCTNGSCRQIQNWRILKNWHFNLLMPFFYSMFLKNQGTWNVNYFFATWKVIKTVTCDWIHGDEFFFVDTLAKKNAL